MSAILNHNKMGELDTISIEGEGFRAVVLLQGAQLIHFLTEDSADNWLWVSEQATYKQGVSVRGGVPICWPVFGQYNANPPKVKQSFANCAYDVSQHGYARLQHFELDSFESSITDQHISDNAGEASRLILTLPEHTHSLNLKVMFSFGRLGFSITLITQNNTPDTLHFTQALHTYLPTADITQTCILGLDGVPYSDTLHDWQRMMQKGAITFAQEIDRIYHAAPTLQLHTPTYHYHVLAQGSQSTVVWNPWLDKSKRLSQFKDDDYQRMLCIETANAHLDSVSLLTSEAHRLTMTLQRHKAQN